MRVRQIVGELYFRAFSVCAVVLEDEVHPLRAVGSKLVVFVPQRRLYSASGSLCLFGAVLDALLRQGVGLPLKGGPFPRPIARTALASAVTEGGKPGSATCGTMPAAVRKLQYVVNAPGLVGVVGVREIQGECLLDLGHRFRVYGGRVVPDCMLGGAEVCLGGSFRGFHRLGGECVVEGDADQLIHLCGPSQLPVVCLWVAFSTFYGVVDGRPFRVWVDGNVGVCGCCHADGLCGSCLGHSVVVSEGAPFDGGRALYGDEEVLSWRHCYLFCCDEVHGFYRGYPRPDLFPVYGALW